MSIGIAIPVQDGVVLVADGRVSDLTDENVPPDDNVDKLVQVAPKVFAVPTGVIPATDEALRQLELRCRVASTPTEVRDAVTASLDAGWSSFEKSYANVADFGNSKTACSLLVTGIVDSSCFVVKYLKSRLRVLGPLFQVDADMRIVVLGGDEEKITKQVGDDGTNAVRGLTYKENSGPVNEVVEAIMDSTAKIVAEVAKHDKGIGGRIRSVVIRHGFAPEKRLLA